MGAAATSAAGGVAATAATTGLIGAGGALTFGGALSGISAISSIIGGIGGLSAGSEQADFAATQAGLQAAEKSRVSRKEARFEQERIDDTLRRQKLAFMASGVTLEGSPLLVMEETRRRGQDNIDEILRGGSASSGAALAEGRISAGRFKSSGRSAFISGIGSAAATFGAQ